MKLIGAALLLMIGIVLGSITFDNISSGWNMFLNFLGAFFMLIGVMIVGNKVKKKPF